jgi:hypothetical protein
MGLASGCGSGARSGNEIQPSKNLNTLSDLNLTSWDELESELQAAFPKTLGPEQSIYDCILESKRAKTVYADGTLPLWRQMSESGFSLISILGYRCIAEDSPAQEFHAALQVLSRRESGASLLLFAKPLTVVNEARLTPGHSATFTKFICDPAHQNLDLHGVTAFLNRDFLVAWAANTDLATVPPEVQAMAVSSSYTASIEQGTPLPESIRRTFDSFATSSSDRLAVFVWHAPDTTDPRTLKAAIERLLRDDTVSDHMYQIALYQKLDLIKATVVEARNLGLSPKQQARFDAFIDTAAKHSAK